MSFAVYVVATERGFYRFPGFPGFHTFWFQGFQVPQVPVQGSGFRVPGSSVPAFRIPRSGLHVPVAPLFRLFNLSIAESASDDEVHVGAACVHFG
jgi:hypothetical protein